MTDNVIVLDSEPGIQRDGTKYDTKNYIDGQWVRFYRNRPLKIGGYKVIDNGTTTRIRTLYNYDNPGRVDPTAVDTYIGRENFVGYITFDANGNTISGEIDRTPATYIPDSRNLWDFDIFISTTGSTANPIVVAHVSPNAENSVNNIDGPIYYGNTTGGTGNAALGPLKDNDNNDIKVSGGIVFAPPLLVLYGNNGFIRWSLPGNIAAGPSGGWPTDGSNTQTISNSKIIKMILTRGSSQPQLLAWTSNSVISLTYSLAENGEDYFFTPVTIDSNTTVMSSNSIIGYANQFFWIGLKQFFFFNGIVQPLPNTTNSQFFFDSVNLQQRGKIWAELVEAGDGETEIWWHFPRIIDPNNPPTECNHAIIYNYNRKIWYDTAISRSAGQSAGIFPRPMMADSNPMNIVTPGGIIPVYPIWMHEFGTDKVSPLGISAIQSYFETHIYDFFEGNANNNRAMRTRRIETDFRLQGNMTVTVINRFFPSDTIENGRILQNGPYTFDSNTPKVDAVNSQGRLVSYRFESNEVGGRYIMGKTLLNYNIGDNRPSGSGNAGVGG